MIVTRNENDRSKNRKRKRQGGSMTIVTGDEDDRSKNKENEVVHMVTISDRNTWFPYPLLKHHCPDP